MEGISLMEYGKTIAPVWGMGLRGRYNFNPGLTDEGPKEERL
jgi:hypothetical protein